MRRVTIWITAVLSTLILAYSHYLNLTGAAGKTGDRNLACEVTTAQATLECQHGGGPGENR